MRLVLWLWFPSRHEIYRNISTCLHFSISVNFIVGQFSKIMVSARRRSNSIPWCTSFHVISSLGTWHIMISNIQHARNEHRSARCGWFQTCFGSAASAFEIIELAYIHCALKENFSVALTEKGFTCISLICRELLVPRSVAL